jgi:hypothetical protein
MKRRAWMTAACYVSRSRLERWLAMLGTVWSRSNWNSSKSRAQRKWERMKKKDVPQGGTSEA